MASALAPFLMFEASAEAAMELYLSVFEGSRATRVERYGPDGPGAEGTILRADLVLAGREVILIDSPVKQDFGFTPALSLFVECDSEEELDRQFAALSEGGDVLMPPSDYGFSAKFTWVADRFGVSWQLNLERAA